MDSKEKAYWTFPFIAAAFDISTTFVGVQLPSLHESNPLIKGMDIPEMILILFFLKFLSIAFGILCYEVFLKEKIPGDYSLLVPVSISFIWMVAGFINFFYIISTV